MSYKPVTVNKPDKAAPAAFNPKNHIIIGRFRDVSGTFPARDANGVLITGNIALVSGASIIRVYSNPVNIKAGYASEGEADNRGFTQYITGRAPGYGKELGEWLANNVNEDLFAIQEFCDTAERHLYGSPCAPLQIEVKADADASKSDAEFSLKSTRKGPIVAIYQGTLPGFDSSVGV